MLEGRRHPNWCILISEITLRVPAAYAFHTRRHGHGRCMSAAWPFSRSCTGRQVRNCWACSETTRAFSTNLTMSIKLRKWEPAWIRFQRREV